MSYVGCQINKDEWDNYDPEQVKSVLTKRPLFCAVEFIETIKNNPDLPSYMRDCIKDVIDTETFLFNKI